ncbi:MAG: glycerol-3-phosphate acyltransferase [bacterium]|nr:MAG: glycerol-3-phosphate acyltransferase [bacterium]
MMPFYAGLVMAYLLGSVPAALIAGRVLGGIDIRTTGSGNAGATNLYRLFGLKPYIAVLAVDIGKGYAATVLITPWIKPGLLNPLQTSVIFGFVSVLGHIFTIFAGFRGGKGAATAAGMMLALFPGTLLVAASVYFVVVSFTHYVSLGSISMALTIPITLMAGYAVYGFIYPVEIYLSAIFLAVIIAWAHRSNIGRLLRGEERKTYFFRKS